MVGTVDRDKLLTTISRRLFIRHHLAVGGNCYWFTVVETIQVGPEVVSNSLGISCKTHSNSLLRAMNVGLEKFGSGLGADRTPHSGMNANALALLG